MKTETILIGGGAALLIYLVYRHQKRVEAGRAALQPQKGSAGRSAQVATPTPGARKPGYNTPAEQEYNRYLLAQEKG